LLDPAESQVHANGQRFGASFDSVVSPPGYEPRPALSRANLPLAACYAASRPTGVRRLQLAIYVQPDGAIADVRIAGEPPESPLSACLSRAVQSTGLPCTPQGRPLRRCLSATAP
jgi:hypothetical protein